MLQTITVNGRVRAYAYDFPVDWVDHAGALPVLVALHGGGDSAEEMIGPRYLDSQGIFTGIHSPGLHPKLVILAPQGLSSDGLVTGSWNSGQSNKVSVLAPDDSAFLAACIEDLDARLKLTYTLRTGLAAPPSMFSKVWIVGFSNGGQMAARFAAESPVVAPARVPTGVVLVSCTTRGWDSVSLYNQMLAPTWDFPPPAGTSVLVIHGALDPHFLVGVPTDVELLSPPTLQLAVDQDVNDVDDFTLVFTTPYEVNRRAVAALPGGGAVRPATLAPPAGVVYEGEEDPTGARAALLHLHPGGHAWIRTPAYDTTAFVLAFFDAYAQ
jgi:poly(3-hydroxybutyrate) depolymerase